MRYEMFEESSRQPLTSAELPIEVWFEYPKIDPVRDLVDCDYAREYLEEREVSECETEDVKQTQQDAEPQLQTEETEELPIPLKKKHECKDCISNSSYKYLVHRNGTRRRSVSFEYLRNQEDKCKTISCNKCRIKAIMHPNSTSKEF